MITKEKGVRILALCSGISKNYTARQLTEYCNYTMQEDFSVQAIRAFMKSRGIQYKQGDTRKNIDKSFNPLIIKDNILCKKWDKTFELGK